MAQQRYHPCENRHGCERLVAQGTEYCCLPCRLAAEGGYEIHEGGILGHSEGCDTRQKLRRME
jgi:hypothetical protein